MDTHEHQIPEADSTVTLAAHTNSILMATRVQYLIEFGIRIWKYLLMRGSQMVVVAIQLN